MPKQVINNRSNTVSLKEVSLGLLAEGKSLRIKPTGYSMFPVIRPGDVVVIAPVKNPSSLTQGDIVVFKRDADFVLHRLTDIGYQNDNIYCTTRGDSSVNADKPVTMDKIIAVVTTIEKKRQKTLRKTQPHRRRINYRRNNVLLKLTHLWKKIIRVIRLNSRN